jgi:hypothetical protein
VKAWISRQQGGSGGVGSVVGATAPTSTLSPDQTATLKKIAEAIARNANK